MLAAVAHRRDQRMLSDVWDHAPTHEDIRACLGRWHTALTARALTLCGLTTAGAVRSPTPLVAVLGEVPHHLWTLPSVAEVHKAV